MAANIETIKFLGCSVVNFSSSMGFNNNPSTLSLTLAEDFDANPSDNFSADNHTSANELLAVSGGTPLSGGNPGTFVKFQTPNVSFVFSGFVTGYRRTKSHSGNLIYLEMSDPRFLLSQIPIINDTNLNINNTSFNVASWNIFCAPAVTSNPINLDWNTHGVRFDKLMEALSSRGFNFYGQNFKIVLDSSFYNQLSGGYRLKQQSGSVEDVIAQAARDAGIDWYVTMGVGGGYNIIEIKGIKRKNQYNFAETTANNGLFNFINTRLDKVSSWEIGRELRQEPCVTIVTGDKVRSLWNASPNGVYNMFSELGNGMVIDRPFVSLDFAATLGWLSFPVVNIHVGETTTTVPSVLVPDIYQNNRAEYPTRTKAQISKSRLGYIATETVLRAALHSKESWITAVWYEYRNFSTGSLKTITYNTYNSFDIGYGFGAQSVNTSSSFTMNPINLGIESPSFDIEKPSHTDSTVGSHSDIIKETVKEAAYQATLRVAQEYYGKKFICRLPLSSICTEIGSSYINNQKKIPIEYDVADSSPDIAHYDTTSSLGFPASLLKSDSAGFRNPNGLFKSFAYFNTSRLENSYNYINYEQFNPYNSVWGHTDVSESIHDTLYYSGVSVEPYRFDPRFAVVTLNEPFNCGIGSYSLLTVLTRDATTNKISTWSLATTYSPINKTDKKGGYLEFISSILNGYSVVLDSDPRLIVNGTKTFINTASKIISADHFYYLQTIWPLFSENINLSEFRLTNFDITDGNGIYIPLQWNYIKYGPWVDGTNHQMPVNMIDDSKLNPWTYGSMARMNEAGAIIAQRSNSSMHTAAYATVSVEGYPELSLGSSIVSTEGTNSFNMTNLTDLSLSFGTDGIKTTYKFKTYFGPVGFTKRSDLDTISYNSVSAAANRNSDISWNKIYEDFQTQQIKSMGGPSNGFGFNAGGMSSFQGSLNSNIQPSEVRVTNPSQAKSRNEADPVMYQESSQAKLSALFTPYTTIQPAIAKGRFPTTEGGMA